MQLGGDCTPASQGRSTRRPSLEGAVARLKLCRNYVSRYQFMGRHREEISGLAAPIRRILLQCDTVRVTEGMVEAVLYVRYHTPPMLFQRRNPDLSRLATLFS